MMSTKPICNHVIVVDTIFEDYFCAENNENYIYCCVKLHKKLLPPEQPFLTQICTKSFVGWRSAPDPARALPRARSPIAEIKGTYF